MRTGQLLRKIDRTLDRMDEHMARGNELMEEIRAERRLSREQHELNLREHMLTREECRKQHELDLRQHQVTRAAVENNTRVTRELLLQGVEHRRFLERIEQGIHAQTQGLLHVLDELRGGRGPGTAPAS